MNAYVGILLICNFHPSRARNYATTIISKLNNFAEVLVVRVHVDVYMATPALRSLTHETLCDTGHFEFTNHHLPITKSLHFKPSILVFLWLRHKKHKWKKLVDTRIACKIAPCNPTGQNAKRAALRAAGQATSGKIFTPF